MTDLISLDCYKEYKNINSTDRDGKFQSLITQVSALVETYCNRKFIDYSTTPKVEWFDAITNQVWLNEFPVINVSTVTTSTNGGIDQDTLIEADPATGGYFVDLEKGVVFTQRTINNFLNSHDTPYRSLEITYTAGYTLDTVPEDLKLCVQDLVHYYENNENKPTQSLLGGTLDNPLGTPGNSFPPDIRRVLDLYRYSPN